LKQFETLFLTSIKGRKLKLIWDSSNRLLHASFWLEFVKIWHRKGMKIRLFCFFILLRITSTNSFDIVSCKIEFFKSKFLYSWVLFIKFKKFILWHRSCFKTSNWWAISRLLIITNFRRRSCSFMLFKSFICFKVKWTSFGNLWLFFFRGYGWGMFKNLFIKLSCFELNRIFLIHHILGKCFLCQLCIRLW